MIQRIRNNKYLLAGILVLITATASAQVVSDSIMIDGHYRRFQFNRPQHAKKGASLLFIMHGSGGTGASIMPQAKQLESIAGKENLLIVYPDGYKRYWNECRRFATSEANKENINEEGFFNAMIDYFSKKYMIDTGRVFAAGFSGGGHMAYKLALTMPGKFRAVTAVVANMPDSASMDCVPSGRPVPVLIINGTLDDVNPYNGGEMFVNNASYGVVRGTEFSFGYWAALAGHAGAPERDSLPDTDPTDNRRIVRFRYKAAGKPEVQLLKVIGGKHDYPKDIDVYTYAWEFFKSQLSAATFGKINPALPLQTVEASCGMCQFDMKGKDCALAVRLAGKPMYVDGTSIDSYGDAHASDGFCNAIRKAEVQGAIVNNKYKVSYFKLLP